MDNFTQESCHTPDVLNLLQKFARVDKTGNLYRFCCKTVELLVNQFFATCNNLIFCKTGLIRGWWNVQHRYWTHFAAINVANEVAHFSFPVLPYLYTSNLCKSDKNNTIHESTLKLCRLQRIVKVYPFKDSFNFFLLNVGSYCPSTIVELFTNLSY